MIAETVMDVGEPGTLRPRALWVIDALQSARGRAASAWWIAREIGDEDALHVLPLLNDMAALGLVARVRGIGYRSSWRLLVAGPVRS